jgi:hypothetical protein
MNDIYLWIGIFVLLLVIAVVVFIYFKKNKIHTTVMTGGRIMQGGTIEDIRQEYNELDSIERHIIRFVAEMSENGIEFRRHMLEVRNFIGRIDNFAALYQMQNGLYELKNTVINHQPIAPSDLANSIKLLRGTMARQPLLGAVYTEHLHLLDQGEMHNTNTNINDFRLTLEHTYNANFHHITRNDEQGTDQTSYNSNLFFKQIKLIIFGKMRRE